MNNYGEIAGQVIGNADALWGAIWATPSSAITPVQDPFSWEGEFQLSFFAINNYGDLLCTAAHGTANGYWYNGSTFTGIASCDAVTALNDSNQIVGTYPHPTNASPANTYNPTACIWSSPTASPTPLDDATTVTSSANALNNSGTVVGTFTTQYPNPVMPHAFVWTSGSGMVDLNGSGVVYPALPSGVTLETALAIDSYGDIVGTGQVVVSGVPSTHAFLLIPSTGGA
jgi:probable HAF family extracellular repeat protein